MGLFFHTFNHAIQVLFKVSFFWFVDAPVLCIFIPIKNPTHPPTIEPTKPQIKPENMKMTCYIKRKKMKVAFLIKGYCTSIKYTSKEILDQLKKSCQQQLDQASSCLSLAQLSPVFSVILKQSPVNSREKAAHC